MDWLRDFLGLNRYYVAWRFECLPGHWIEGDNLAFRRCAKKRLCQKIADSMNREYGAGTHWVVKVEDRE